MQIPELREEPTEVLKIRWDNESWELDTILTQTARCQILSFLKVGHFGKSVEINAMGIAQNQI